VQLILRDRNREVVIQCGKRWRTLLASISVCSLCRMSLAHTDTRKFHL